MRLKQRNLEFFRLPVYLNRFLHIVVLPEDYSERLVMPGDEFQVL
jgi:hypothetical protein